jgi:hypothetical protein
MVTQDPFDLHLMSVSARCEDGDDTKAERALRRPQGIPCEAPLLADNDQPVQPRVLFLDDDPNRAQRFLEKVPAAVWVKSVAECLPRLNEVWDEIHLDHDLEGETLVDTNRDDSGMEVIRWLCHEPRPHLNQTRFFVHTHNFVAGLLMVLQMHERGYIAEFRPFGHDLASIFPEPEGENSEPPPAPAVLSRGWRRWVAWIADLPWPTKKRPC